MLCGYKSFVNLQINLIFIQYPVCLNVVFGKIRTKNESLFSTNEQTQRKYGHPKSRDQDDSAYNSKVLTVDIEIK